MAHLIQILVIAVLTGVAVHSWSVFLMLVGLELISCWRHNWQHHRQSFLANPAWCISGVAVMFIGILVFK